MAGQKHIPHGTDFTFASNTVGGLVNIQTPPSTRGEAETTDHDSTFDREFLPGLRDNGTITVECRRLTDDAGQSAMLTNVQADRVIEECVITLPGAANDNSDTTTYTFDGFVVSADGDDLDATVDEAANRSFEIRVTGGVTVNTA